MHKKFYISICEETYRFIPSLLVFPKYSLSFYRTTYTADAQTSTGRFKTEAAGEETIFHGRRRRVSFRCSINKSAVSLTTAVGNWCMGIYIVPIFIAYMVSITVASQGDYSGFQVTGMTEWGKKSKPPKITRTSNNAQKNPWTKN